MAAGKDIQYFRLEAESRWLRPAEFLGTMAPFGGSLWLFNRNVLRGFRKDGHNWHKNKDGYAVKEGHEKLKAGGVDVLHCYYAHGEENKSFHRRSYWMLDEAYKHIVLVHYRKVKKVHVRGYKVRKHYRNIFMSFGIVEVILRWRRKGSGFRKFRHEALIAGFATRTESCKGQAKERWQKALVRVNSMVQYPEAINQHCRLLAIAPEFQETEVMDDWVLYSSEVAGAYGEDDLMSMLLSDDFKPC